MTEDDWLSIWYDNTSSCIGLTQALVKEQKISRGGLIVYCSSIQANTPRKGRGLYAASKAALEAFGKTVAVELADQGIRCVTLRLGQLTETMGGVVFGAEERSRLEQRALLPWVDPGDVAKLCFDLYEQKSLTGTVIELDSGHGRNVW
jgi:NAD(P)-dependent dehydrogenase (short-subunit alcohol dehydrogenase family)